MKIERYINEGMTDSNTMRVLELSVYGFSDLTMTLLGDRKQIASAIWQIRKTKKEGKSLERFLRKLRACASFEICIDDAADFDLSTKKFAITHYIDRKGDMVCTLNSKIASYGRYLDEQIYIYSKKQFLNFFYYSGNF